jgi:hypothetical protein
MDYNTFRTKLSDHTNESGHIKCLFKKVAIDTTGRTPKLVFQFENPVGEYIYPTIPLDWQYISRLDTPLLYTLFTADFKKDTEIYVQPTNSNNCSMCFDSKITAVYPTEYPSEITDFTEMVVVEIVRNICERIYKYTEDTEIYAYLCDISQIDVDIEKYTITISIDDSIGPLSEFTVSAPFTWDTTKQFVPAVESEGNRILLTPTRYTFKDELETPQVTYDNWTILPGDTSVWDRVFEK